jgi:uroporphyrinogen-III synthase
MKLLVIRPQPGAEATAARVRAAGHQSMLMPLFAVQPVQWEAPSPANYDALLLTSGNAVRQAGTGLQSLHELPTYAIGSATACAAGKIGLAIEMTGDRGIAAMLAAIQSAGHQNVLWLAGADRIAASTPDGMTLDVRVVYESAALAAPPNFGENVDSADAVLLHSPRAADYFASLCDAQAIDRAGVTIAALSPTIAKSVGDGWRKLLVASSPNDAALLSRL